MIFEPLAIPDVVLVTPKVRADARGAFSETFRASLFAEIGFDRPVAQENLARTRRAGVVRGLHFQRPPCEQEKLLQVISGVIFDVAVDIRPASPTLGRWVGVRLDATEPRQLFIPRGFAHGYLTLSNDCALVYKTGAYYAPEAEAGLRWNDPALGIDWKLDGRPPILSDKDTKHPVLAELPPYFTYA